jgi:hypothetical protein
MGQISLVSGAANDAKAEASVDRVRTDTLFVGFCFYCSVRN